ncbi:SusC/RagA family TonB-linked outer membrane protein [Chitinophaga sp. sic0106]|uniref:SusC/RagA family TonB-linked outer membrane protein n=1 Tax=Chitinophaga sp. sic0106 TaxID=2854785 RepID=UPI001C472715|nr:SusC/RagA family TonB-linked outer membrane protein [Chitinophaga sp. sic0106]MBV7530703.1 SusC/RagA family TonB-linked outer membrane protein [Chitinophaga sp. sic0106]
MKRCMNLTSYSFYLLIFLICCGSTAFSQQAAIKGTVRDAAAKSPLPGVTINVKGSSSGTTTDANGHFTLNAASDAVLIFSFMGYDKQEIPVAGKSTLDVALQQTTANLGEVVVTALGIERKTRSLGYATQQIKGADLSMVKDPNGNIMNSLSGKVAGIVTTPAATGPGSAVRVVLRGNRSLTGNNNALVVVDGVPIDNTMSTEAGGGGSVNTIATQSKSTGSSYSGSDGASSINPQDIESINVLKGPAAAALYGSRAANGALIITTKSGKAGKMTVNYNGGIALEQPNLLMKFQNTYGRGNGGTYSPAAAESWGAPRTTYPDNVRNFYNNGTSITNSVDISGGSDKLRGYASYTNNSNTGIIEGNSLLRHTLNLRLNAQITSRLSADVKVTYLDQKIKNKPRLGDNGVANEALIMPRDMSSDSLKIYERYDATGKPIPVYWTNSSIYVNPYWDVNRTSLNEQRSRVTILGTAKYKLTDWLNLQGRYSLDRYDDNIDGSYYEGTLAMTVAPGGRYLEGNISAWERNMDLLLSGTNKMGSDFGVSYNIGAALNDRRGKNKQTIANGLVVPNRFHLNFAATPQIAVLDAERQIQSVYGSASFDFRQYLYLDVSARNDWSSTLPAPHSYFYPSVAFSAIITDMAKLPSWISYGKVRATYSQVGNDADPYLLLQAYSYTQGTGNGFISRDNLKYIPNLKPEQTKAYELGLDWKFLNDRIGIDLSLYKTNTINQLIFVGVPQATGFNQQYVNIGNIENRGIEIVLNGSPVVGKNFNWNSTLNFAHNKNKVISLTDDIQETSLSASNVLGSLLIRPGGSYGDIYDKVWATDEKTGQHIVNSAGLPVMTAGLQKIGNFNPDFTLGWGNRFSYKQFDLNLLIDGRVGGILVSGTDAFLGYYGIGDYTAQFREGGLVLPGVHEDGTPNTTAINAEKLWTNVSQSGRNGYAQFFAYSATNFRLRELALSYNFPLHSSVLKQARVSLTGRNLFFLYRGKSILDIPGMGKRKLPVDPESAIGTSNYQGIESGLLPATRSFGVNVSLSF